MGTVTKRKNRHLGVLSERERESAETDDNVYKNRLGTHRKVFLWVLGVIADHGLLKGKTVGVDATTLEANAAMRSIVRRDTGASHEEFLKDLAQQSGIETLTREDLARTREDLARVDRKREKKSSNLDWESPTDPDARIAKMKDRSTHLAHKAEHAVDMETGAVIAVTLQAADQGDITTIHDPQYAHRKQSKMSAA